VAWQLTPNDDLTTRRVHLASDAAHYSTGALLTIDAGVEVNDLARRHYHRNRL